MQENNSNPRDGYDGSAISDNQEGKEKIRSANKRKKAWFILLTVVCGIVFFAVLLLLAVNMIFKVQTIEISGSKYYSDSTVLDTIGLHEGVNIFLTSEDKYAEILAEKCPMIHSVKLTREYPSKVIIELTDEEPEYSFERAGRITVVGKGGKVLYSGNDEPTHIEMPISVTPPSIKRALVGYVIRFEDELDDKAMIEIMTVIKECSYFDKITRISVESRFDIKLWYEDRYEIRIGEKKDLSAKLKFAEAIIKKVKEEKGIVDVKNCIDGKEAAGYFIITE